MNINEILRYEPKIDDIIMHKDGSYHVIISVLKQGSMVVSAMHHINGSEPVAVYLKSMGIVLRVRGDDVHIHWIKEGKTTLWSRYSHNLEVLCE